MKLQGKTLIQGLDVVKEASAQNVALVKQVGGVTARDKLTLESAPRTRERMAEAEPIIDAVEVYEKK